ncbi:MAG: DUF2845 domain-containing protein [Thermodesulfobacteriota bacterium]
MNLSRRVISKILFLLGISFLFTILSFTMIPEGRSSDFSCGSKIVSTGDRKFDVLRKCGEPAHIEAREEVRIKRDFGPLFSVPEGESGRSPLLVKELVAVEEWEYNLGPGRFIRYLRFENGILVSITTGDYGY